MMSSLITSCLMMASSFYNVPSSVLLGIMQIEGGRPGMESANRNGTHDLGPMQVNTLWLPQVARHWNVDPDTARAWVRDDVCVNINVAGWILRQKINEAHGDLALGIARYHSATPGKGIPYARKVVARMRANAERSQRELTRLIAAE